MQNIPMFTTENGVGSLVLKDIPYSGDAYVYVLDSGNIEPFIDECYAFCKMAGAGNVYISGKDIPDKYPLYTEIWVMESSSRNWKSTDAILVPVDDSNVQIWRELYNIRMADVPVAAFMSGARIEQLLKKGTAYLIYRDKTLLGIGAVSENRMDCIASAFRGAGGDVLLALRTAILGNIIELEVASTNRKAISFYERFGFSKKAIKEIWHKYIP